MKKSVYLFLIMMCVLTAGCGGKQVNIDTGRTTEAGNADKQTEQQENVRDTQERQSVGVADTQEKQSEAVADTDEQQSENVTETEENASETKYITIDLSDVKETHAEGETVTPLNWNVESEEYNGSDSADEWYDSENLSLPMIGYNWDNFYDDNYQYLWADEELFIYEKETGNCLYEINYPTDKWYINGNNAYLKDGIFYGASVTNSYATPDTCFMFAYDLNNDKLLWRSADQSYNSMNFIVKGDIIICGYGFTEEDDYLYQINRYTGEIIDKMRLKKMPDLLVEQGNKLYVHTYSYDYVIEMEQ